MAGPPPPRRGRVRPLAEEVELFCREVVREAYRTGAGLQREGHEARIYRKWRPLFLPAARRSLPPGPPRVRQRLQEFIDVGRVDRSLSDLQDRRRNRLMAASVELQGREVPFYTASVRLAELSDRKERHALYGRLASVLRSVAPEDEAIWRGFRRGVRGLGYRDGRAACEGIFGYDVPRIQRETRGFLRRTERLYLELLGERAASEGLAASELRCYDARRVLRGLDYSRAFPRTGLAPFLRRTVRDLGLPWGVFRMDLEERPRKNPRAFCAGVRIPQEVYLVLRPHGGHDDYHVGLHEMGHALHGGLTDPGLEPVLARTGDGSLTEGWAFVLDFLFLNRPFRRRLVPEEGFARFYAFTQLHLLRRYCGKIEYEAQFFRDPTSRSLPALYERTQVGSTRFRADEEHDLRAHWRADVDPWMYTAAYLRAWMFAGSVTEVLLHRWGERWWSSSEAGAWLARQWARGQAPRVEELLEEAGAGGLSLEPLERLIRGSLEG